jgi:predicted O-methyltransferase YrrM
MGALDLVGSIPGWLRDEDAEQLYRLAASTPGPILEIGTYRGKSAVLMALAVKQANRDTTLFTLDINPAALRFARRQATAFAVADTIVFVRGTSRAFARAYPRMRPTLTFVDGDHSAHGVRRDLVVLESIVPEGGKLLFHDFNDPLNADPRRPEVKVRPTVESSWVASQCRFEGVFGVCGLYTRQEPPAPDAGRAADLHRLDSLTERYLWPARSRARPRARARQLLDRLQHRG